MKSRYFCATALAASLAAASPAQSPVSPSPPGQTPTVIGRSLSVTYLMNRYGISETDAQERVAVLNEVVALSTRLNNENDPAYADLYIDHSPVFRVVVAFADAKDRKGLLDSLSPRLRRYVQLVVAPKSRKQVEGDLDALASALSGAGLAFGGGFNPKNRRYRIEVETQAAASTARERIPTQLRGEVDIEIRPLPKPEAAPTGVQAGDWIAGGYTLYTSTNPVRSECTFGFPVRFGSPEKKGVVTAGHCGTFAAHYYNNHWINFSTPVLRKNLETKYDYEIFESTGLTDGGGYEVYFSNTQNVQQFPASGYLKIYARINFVDQNIGMPMCKSGQQSGVTCGEIYDDNYLYNGVRGWIAISNSYQSI